MKTKEQLDNSKWIIGILIGVIAELIMLIIFVIAYRLSDNADITNIIAIASGGISIALAFVAIWITLSQGINSNTINVNTTAILDKLSQKINKIDTDISNIDLDNITMSMGEQFDKLQKEIATKFNDNEGNKETLNDKKTYEFVKRSIDKTKEEAENTISSYKNNNLSVLRLKEAFENYDRLSEKEKNLVINKLSGVGGFKLVFKDGKVSKVSIKSEKSS